MGHSGQAQVLIPVRLTQGCFHSVGKQEGIHSTEHIVRQSTSKDFWRWGGEGIQLEERRPRWQSADLEALSSEWHHHVTLQLPLAVGWTVRRELRGREGPPPALYKDCEKLGAHLISQYPKSVRLAVVRFFRLDCKMFLGNRDNLIPRSEKHKPRHAETLNSFYFISFI